MRYASVCSGISCESVAWTTLGWKPVFFSEIDPFASALLARRYPHVPNLGDFTKVMGEEYAGKIDILIAGTPCQSYSLAGRRAGIRDPRGNLALEYARLLEGIQPRYFIWENVPGVLSSGKGRDFAAILRAFCHAGYGLCFRVLDARWFGVPQRRRRVFVVGHLGDWRIAAAVLLERHCLCGDSSPRSPQGQGVAGALAPRTRGGGGLGADFERDGGPQVCSSVTAKWAKGTGGSSGDETQNLIAFSMKDSGNDASPLCPTLRAMPHNASHANGGGQVAVATMRVSPTLRADGGALRPEKNSDAVVLTCCPTVSHTLKASGNDPQRVDMATYVTSGWSVRRLTPVEAERLQGLPDNYTRIEFGKGGRKKDPAEMARYWGVSEEEVARFAADSHRYRAIGNGMAVPVVRWIGQRIEMVERMRNEAKTISN